MRKKLSRISAAIVVILTALLGMFSAQASANGMDDNSVYVNSGEAYTYKLNKERPYLKFTVFADGEVNIWAQTEGKVPNPDYSTSNAYNSYTNFELYDSVPNRVCYWYRYNNTTHIAALNETIKLKAGTYYLWQYPCDDNRWSENAVSKVTITYPTPAPSPKINKISTGNRKAWVYWNGMTGATSYRVYVVQNGKERLAGTTKQTKFLVAGMTNGVRANYYVKAVINGRLSTAKNIAYSTPRNGVKPGLSVSSNRCVISWNKYQGATKYKIVAVDPNKKILAERVTTKTTFDWRGFAKGKKYGFYIVPFVGNDYIPFGRSYAEDQANISFFTAK